MVTAVIEASPEAGRTLPSGRALPRVLQKAFSFPALLAALLAFVVFLVLHKRTADPDITWHLRNAQILFKSHAFLRQDVYSFTTRGRPWVDPEWLSEIPFYLGWRWFGAQGIFLVTLVAIEAILLGIFALAYLQSKSPKAAFAVSFAAIFLADVSFGPRTLLFGWLMLVIELGILYRFRADIEPAADGRNPSRDFLWTLPPLFLLWINLHGSWMIGLVLLGLFILSGAVEGNWGRIQARRWSPRQARKLAWTFALSVLALFLNPYGWRLVVYPFDMAFRQQLNIANVLEWRSVDFHDPRGKIVLAIMAGAILLQLIRRRNWMLHEVLFLLLGLYSALTYSRFLFLGAILILPLLATDLAESMPYDPGRDKPGWNAAIMLGLLAAVVSHYPANRQLDRHQSREYPTQALPYLSHFHPDGNVFTDYAWGGFLIWNVR